jgi:hypothetical protein
VKNISVECERFCCHSFYSFTRMHAVCCLHFSEHKLSCIEFDNFVYCRWRSSRAFNFQLQEKTNIKFIFIFSTTQNTQHNSSSHNKTRSAKWERKEWRKQLWSFVLENKNLCALKYRKRDKEIMGDDFIGILSMQCVCNAIESWDWARYMCISQ